MYLQRDSGNVKAYRFILLKILALTVHASAI